MRISRVRQTPNDVDTFDHDGLSRLKRFERAGTAPFVQEWLLDSTDNWHQFRQDNTGDGTFDLVQDRRHDPANKIRAISQRPGDPAWVQPVYDNNGNLIRAPRTDDPTKPLSLKYDAWNRLTEVRAGGTAGKLLARNHYDGLNRRVAKEVFQADGVTLDHTRHYYYSLDWQVLEEWVDKPGSVLYLDKEYIWSREAPDELLARVDTSYSAQGTPSDTWLWPLQDQNGNVLDLVQESGGAATVVERYRYQAYGQPQFMDGARTPISQSAFNWDVLFAGYKYDPETGLYLVRNRVLHPGLGRWLTRDPREYEDSANLYQYGLSAPGTYVDPTGELAWFVIPLGLLFTGGAALGAVHGWSETVISNPEATAGQQWLGGGLGALFGVLNPVGEFASSTGAAVGYWGGRAGWWDPVEGMQWGGLAGGIAGGFGTAFRQFAVGGAREGIRAGLRAIAPEVVGAAGGAGIATALGGDPLHGATWGMFGLGAARGIFSLARGSRVRDYQRIRDVQAWLLNRFRVRSTRFYSVHGSEDVSRLRWGGRPWPTGLERANFGAGFYAWRDRVTAARYLEARQLHIASQLRVVGSRVLATRLRKMRTLDLTQWSDEAVDAWHSMYTQYGQGLPHRYEHIINPSGMGHEHFFSPSAFRHFRL